MRRTIRGVSRTVQLRESVLVVGALTLGLAGCSGSPSTGDDSADGANPSDVGPVTDGTDAGTTGCPPTQPAENNSCSASAPTCAYGGFITCCGQSYGAAVTCQCGATGFHCTDWQKVCAGELCNDAQSTDTADATADIAPDALP